MAPHMIHNPLKRSRSKRQATALIVCLMLALLAPLPGRALENSTKRFLQEGLVAKGLDAPRARRVIFDKRLKLDREIIVKNLYHSSPQAGTQRPDHMDIDHKYIRKGRAFITDHASDFARIEDAYGVSPAVITAILIVESRLATYPQKYHVLHAYANLAACLDPTYFAQIRKAFGERYPSLREESINKRVEKKGAWALNELYQLIVLADQLQLDPLEIKGSFAGAMGPAQFIPSSFVLYGVDGNQDGRRDPFDMVDAMASIANYLKLAGWSPQATDERKRKAIWTYNHSEVYVNTIMMLIRELSPPR